ncbi:unnamed protein product [Vitrella brassicaformis CCMP3155]|uniref:Uncharacterized protein n=2 Tax=Vitrella brassicaformis TaxID=1169539 RepID=A0A0G4EUJ3_VITBC|nr:unnamed protein product [Vitrella brassicaformis CCMP3155]|eukprot:CEM01891.1 unnamed protein product [Vitrella brassicaformis CCMP3155]
MAFRDVFVVAQDPFWFDGAVFDYWLHGLSIDEALGERRKAFGIEGSDLMGGVGVGTAPHSTFDAYHFGNLLSLIKLDTAHLYHVFELLELQLYSPQSFLSFSTLQIRASERRTILRKFYSLDPPVVREVLKTSKPLSIKQKAILQIVRATGVRHQSVQRQVENIRRMCRWLDTDDASQPQTQRQALAQLSELFGDTLGGRYYRINFIISNKIEVFAKRTSHLTFLQVDEVVSHFLSSFTPTADSYLDPVHLDAVKTLHSFFKNVRNAEEFRQQLRRDWLRISAVPQPAASAPQPTAGVPSVATTVGTSQLGAHPLRVEASRQMNSALVKGLLQLIATLQSPTHLTKLFSMLTEFADRIKAIEPSHQDLQGFIEAAKAAFTRLTDARRGPAPSDDSPSHPIAEPHVEATFVKCCDFIGSGSVSTDVGRPAMRSQPLPVPSATLPVDRC